MPCPFAKPVIVLLWAWLVVGSPLQVWAQQKKSTPKSSKGNARRTPRPAAKTKRAVQPGTLPKQANADTVQAVSASSLALVAERDTSRGPDSVKVSNDLTSTVVYSANDSIVFQAKTRVARLYGAADITYGDINLKADQVQVNYQTSIVDANGVKDSTGRAKGTPIFTQGAEKYQAERMRYNFKTRKGLIRQVVTQQGEGYLHGEAVKRESETAFFVRNAEYTTCNLAHPHFYIKSYKMKMIPNEKLVSGPFLLHVGDVPTPLGFVFGFFPIPKYKSSGILIPTYGESGPLGFFLRNGGFYFALSDYFDLKLLGEIYSLGGWGLTPQSTYRKRYKYDGNISLRYNNRSVLNSNTGERINCASQEFWINWTHTPAARGNSRFSASVSAGTARSQQLFNFSQNALFQTTYTSNVNYSTSFPGTPFAFSVAGRFNQNVRTQDFSLELPTVALTMNRIFPFKRAGSTKSNILTNLNVAYNLTGQSTINSTRVSPLGSNIQGIRLLGQTELPIDPVSQQAITNYRINTGTLPTLLRNARIGIQHQIPISTTARVFRYFNVSPSLNYREIWYPGRLRYTYTEQGNGLRVDTVRGFNRFYDFSASVNLTTQIYGTFFVRRGKLEAIRHRLTPNIGLAYRPDFGGPGFGFFQRTVVDSGRRTVDLNPFTGFLYGGPTTGGRQGAITFGLTNVLEAKLRKVSDSGKTTYKKRNLIENLSIGGSYNAIADSFRLSTINVALNTRLFDKINIASVAVLDPYSYENVGPAQDESLRRMARRRAYAWQAGQGIGRLAALNTSIGFNLNPAAGKTRKPVARENLTEAEERELSFIYANPQLFVDFNIPWTLNVQYNNTLTYQTSGSRTYQFNQFVRTSGDVSISPKWKVGFDAPFDIKSRRFASTGLNIYRDLHCWEMRMGVFVGGTRPMYNFDINVKASILQDLKLSKRNSFYDR